MKHTYSILAALFCALITHAQTTDGEFLKVREELNNMFMLIDSTTVPTGYLLDYGVDLVEFVDYDGSELTESNTVNFSSYQDIVKSVLSCDVSETALPDITDMMETFQNIENIAISLTAIKYSYIKNNALEDNLISYNETTGQVSYVYIDGVRQNPYYESVIIACSPNRDSYASRSVTYEFPTDFWISNLAVQSIYFDADDGVGYRLVTSSSPININYADYGLKDLKIKLHTTDGSVYLAHSVINITNAAGPNNAPSVTGTTPPTDTLIFHTAYEGQTIKAKVSYYCIPGNTTITRPFIVAEGFDPWIFNYLDKDIPDEEVHMGFTNHIEFFDDYWKSKALQNQYDLVYIDWDDSLVDIRANAQLLIQIIERINEMKADAGSTEKNVVMGQSMGGLIARYALRSMELESKAHETATFISHDSPHLGANVPLGALYFVRQALSFTHGFDTAINIVSLLTGSQLTVAERRLYSVLNAKSVKQMLINYVGDYYNIDNQVHNSWQQTLNEYGFPNDTENIAIINGRQYDVSSTLGLGSHLLYLSGYAKTSWTTDLAMAAGNFLLFPLGILDVFGPLNTAFVFLGSTKLNVHAEINPLLSSFSGNVISKLNVYYVKKFLWLFPKTYTLHSSAYYAPANSLFYDDFPGSQYLLKNFGGPENVINETHSSPSNNWGEYSFDVRMGNKIMFIPTASALAIKSSGSLNASHFMRDYFNDPPTPGTETPFNAYSLATAAEGHIHLNDTVFEWLNNQLHVRIEGPDTLSVSANYTLAGYSGPVQWKTSDNSKAVIDNNGKLTAIKNGSVTIAAESYSNGQLIRKTKTVMIGFPDLAIRYEYSSGDGHIFKVAVPDDNDAEMINMLVSEGKIRYEWSILCNEEGLITTIGTSPKISHMTQEDEVVTVYLRLVDNNGNKSDTYSKTLNLRNPFSVNYKYVEVNSLGVIRFVKENGYEAGMPSEDLSITFRNIAYNPTDNLFTLIDKYIKGNICYLGYRYYYRFIYLDGIKVGTQSKWKFPFFDSTYFTDELSMAINDATNASLSEGIVKDFEISIYNSAKDQMQRIPFAIIYKPL